MTLLRFSLLILLLAPAATAQETPYVLAMETAIANEDTTRSLGTMLDAMEAFKRIAQEWPDEWESYYWLSHLYGQAGLFDSQNMQDALLDSAEVYYEKGWAVWARSDDRTKIQEGDFYTLRSNLYGLRGMYHRQQNEQQEARVTYALDSEYLLRAALVDPDNPRLHMMRGLDMLRHETTREEGRRILQGAIERYEARPPATSIAPNWGRPWIDAWLNRYSS